MQILRDGGTFGEPIRFFSIEDMYNEDHFTTLLFFMGMLTRGEIIEGRTYLKIPNYSIRTLYWEYAVAHVQHLEAETISTDIYLLRHPAVPDIKFEYVFEVKYLKAGSTKAEKEAKFTEAAGQIERYKKDPRFTSRNDLKFAAIVFEGKGEHEAREM